MHKTLSSIASALEAGYEVQAVVDACGTRTPLTGNVTHDRFQFPGTVNHVSLLDFV